VPHSSPAQSQASCRTAWEARATYILVRPHIRSCSVSVSSSNARSRASTAPSCSSLQSRSGLEPAAPIKRHPRSSSVEATPELRVIFKARCRGPLDRLFLYRSVAQKAQPDLLSPFSNVPVRSSLPWVIVFTTSAVLGPRSVSYTTSFCVTMNVMTPEDR
jgi:hypothetical protein